MKYFWPIAAILVGFAVLAALRLDPRTHLDQISAGLFYSAYWGLTFIGAATFLAWKAAAPDWGLFTRFILAGTCGAVIGAALGIFFFPLSAQEQTQFDAINKVVGGLLAGAVGVQLIDLWKFLTNAPAGGGVPPIFKPNFAVATGLFITSLGLAGIVEYAARFWVDNKVTITPVPNQDGLRDGPAVLTGKSVRFAGAATSPQDVAVHWRLENSSYPKALDPMNPLITVDRETGIVTTKPNPWPSDASFPVHVNLVASSDADPKTGNSLPILIEDK